MSNGMVRQLVDSFAGKFTVTPCNVNIGQPYKVELICHTNGYHSASLHQDCSEQDKSTYLYVERPWATLRDEICMTFK